MTDCVQHVVLLFNEQNKHIMSSTQENSHENNLIISYIFLYFGNLFGMNFAHLEFEIKDRLWNNKKLIILFNGFYLLEKFSLKIFYDMVKECVIYSENSQYKNI